MRANGLLTYYDVTTSGALDGYGEVGSVATGEWSDPIPCNIRTGSDERGALGGGGTFRDASYTIYVEAMAFPYGRVRLWRRGEPLGEYRVLSAEPVEAVGRTQITVCDSR